jgi:hypothetical protein
MKQPRSFIAQYILAPRNMTQSLKVMSTSSLIRGTINLAEDKVSAYSKFRSADEGDEYSSHSDDNLPENAGIHCRRHIMA